MGTRKFTPESKLEAVKLVRERGITASQAAKDLVGEPSEGMMVVGEIEPGGYLYLSVGSNRPGAFFARFPFQDPMFYRVADDFDDLRGRSRPDPDG